jgi:uncharacterized membrane protein
MHSYMPRLLVALGLAGLAVSAYLVATHFGDQPIECGGVGDCNYVNSSEYASVGGVPVSLLGMGMYVALAATAAFWSLKPGDDKRMVAYWGLALAGAGYAAYLTYVELAILHAVCVYCVVSACILAVSLALSTWALFATPPSVEDSVVRGRRHVPAKARR